MIISIVCHSFSLKVVLVGWYQCKLHMAFGLQNGLSVFQRLMDIDCPTRYSVFSRAYIDDIVIYSGS